MTEIPTAAEMAVGTVREISEHQLLGMMEVCKLNGGTRVRSLFHTGMWTLPQALRQKLESLGYEVQSGSKVPTDWIVDWTHKVEEMDEQDKATATATKVGQQDCCDNPSL